MESKMTSSATAKLPASLEELFTDEGLNALQVVTSAMRKGYNLRRKEAAQVKPDEKLPAPTEERAAEYAAIVARLVERDPSSSVELDANKKPVRGIIGPGIWAAAMAKADGTPVSPTSWYKAKAAIQAELDRAMWPLKDILDRHRRPVDPSKPEKRPKPTEQECGRAAGALLDLARTWEAMPSGGAPVPKQRRQGKRRQVGKLAKLDPDWRMKIYARLPEQDKLPFLAAAATGARPGELHHGIQFVSQESLKGPLAEKLAGKLALRVMGGKVRDNAGQPWRDVVIGTEPGSLGAELKEAWLRAGQPAKVRCAGTKEAFSLAVAYAAAKVWPKHATGTKAAVSAYSLRHAFAADGRAQGLSAEQLAEAMGHISTRSQGQYGGRKGSGKGAVSLAATRAARPVRNTSSTKATREAALRPAKVAATPVKPARPRPGPG